MSGLTIFVCADPWEAYLRQLQADGDREQAERERDEDIDHEHALGSEALLDAEDDGCDPDDYIPEYAARPYEVCEPEVIEL